MVVGAERRARAGSECGTTGMVRGGRSARADLERQRAGAKAVDRMAVAFGLESEA